MSAVQVLGPLACLFGLAGALTMLLQTRALRRARRACEVSMTLLAVWTVGYAVWASYGMALGNPIVLVVNGAGVLGSVSALAVAVRLRRTSPCPMP
jgi:uncharacterized protein with PQ loop repeat